MEDKETIIAKVNKYIDWLATPNEAFNGFPICPFAEKERSSGKLKYEIFKVHTPVAGQKFVENTKSLFDIISEWDMDDNYTSMIIAHLADIELHQCKNFQHYINRGLRKRKMGYIKTICFHPDDTFEVGGVKTRNAAPYFLINVAYIDELNKAHQNLKNTKYYDNLTAENKKYLKVESP